MNYIWGAMMLISIISSIITGRVDETVNAVFEGAHSSVDTLISLAGAMCFWTGIMKIAERSGISYIFSRLISPITRYLFPGSSSEARRYITMNMTANLLGMGNAATPMGMLAAEALDKENKKPDIPSANLSMLVVINTTAFQLIPTTIIALRASAGSVDVVSVIVPIWLTSLFPLAAGIAAVKIMNRSL